MTLKALYQSVTRDTLTHQATITALLARQSTQRRKLVPLYLKNLTDREVGRRTRRSNGAARSMLRLTMLAIHKRALSLPRYHQVGRAHPRADQRQARAIAARMDPDGQPPQAPPGGPVSARDAMQAAPRPADR